MICGALSVDVEALKDPTILVQLPYGNDDLPANVGVLHYISRHPGLKACY
jgi:hypothetical protein